MSKSSTGMKVGGIDVAKRTLEAAVNGVAGTFSVPNDVTGYAEIVERFRVAGVLRVGLEASGNYEAAVVRYLRKAGFEVVLFDPVQLHGYRRFKKRRAKTDPIDAALIAAATAAIEAVHEASDERVAPWADDLTLIEQITQDIARLKTRLERFADKRHRAFIATEIKRLCQRRKDELARLTRRMGRHADITRRLELLRSIPGIGLITALSFVIRMPELGRMSRGEAAALVGVAPYNTDSGDQTGERHIAGGRKRLRRIVYLATFSASLHWNPILMALYRRLLAAGKHHKLAITACARKLVEIANAVLRRGTPWRDRGRAGEEPAGACIA